MKLSLFQLSCTVALCLFFSTVNNVVEGQLRGGSTKPRQLQEGAVAEAMGGEKDKKVKNDPKEKKVTNPKKELKPKHEFKPKKTKAPRPSPTTTGDEDVEDVAVEAAMVFVVDSNSTTIDDDDIFSNSTVIDDDDIASNSTAVDDDDIASNSTAIDESDADEEEGEGEVRY
mmetsp:Transcript_48077/g.54522  ORF Transcript_48077/g.54522 Transcript_48077/m.54522 type:complete len:171 (+) Transcript_48077:127-639(+)